MKKILIALALASVGAFAAAPAVDTSLVLKPTPEQVKAAKDVGNKKCPVSGEEIGGMGPGKTVIYKGQAVHLCCGSCVKKFAADPAKYLAMVQPAVKSEKHDMKDMPAGHHMN